MVISELLHQVKDIISPSSETAVLDAKLILQEVTGYDNVHLVINGDEELTSQQVDLALEMACKRSKHMPMAYLLEKKEFMSLEFEVNENVLIPRADTECIVEEAIRLVKTGNILDIGCGSGAIAVSLAKYIPDSTITALDLSEAAVSVAERNAYRNNVNVKFICEDIFEFKTTEKFDLIISNPPYIESEELDALMPDVKCYEPMSALDGGEDGLMFYRRIVEFAVDNLKPDGFLIFEFGWKQFDAVSQLIIDAGLDLYNTVYDISGIKRGCTAIKIK